MDVSHNDIVSLDADEIIVKGIARNIAVISIKDITNIKRYEQTDATVRRLGIGGMFGTLGKFENEQLGEFQMYTTNKKNMVLIETKTGCYVVGCEKSDLLIQYIKDSES